MSKNQNSGSGKTNETIKKEDVFQAVVLCSNFDGRFPPIGRKKPVPLFPLVNVPLLAYTLECLALTGVQEVILFCTDHADLLREFVKNNKRVSNTMLVTVLVSERCRSLGDAMRDLDAKAVIRGNFLLLHGDTVCNVSMLPLLEDHKMKLKQDKGAVMTAIYMSSSPKHHSQQIKEELLLGVDPSTQRIVFHRKATSEGKQINMPLDVLLESDGVELMAGLCDTGICICSTALLQLFCDNFDFQTQDDLMRGLLIDEEILAGSMYCHVITGAAYAVRVNSWKTYRGVSADVIHRWVYPLVPDCPINCNEEAYMFLRRNVYRKRSAKLSKGCVLEEDVVLAEECIVGENATITRSIIGPGCIIGARTIIKDSILWDSIHIAEDCVIDSCLVSNGCSIGPGVHLAAGCVLPPGLRLPEGPLPRSISLVAPSSYEVGRSAADSDDDADLDDLFVGSGCRTSGARDSLTCSSVEDSDRDSPLPDDTKLFFAEVFDSLTRGNDEKLDCDNLILEINSSRYAYNVSVSEVTFHVTRAIFRLPPSGPTFLAQLSAVLNYFKPILINYVQRGKEAQEDCLAAIEETAESRPELVQTVHKVLHMLYDKDILEEATILSWYRSSHSTHAGLQTSTALRNQAAGFIKWLQEADEETDSGDES